MHYTEFNIRICESDVHRGEAEVNITFSGWQILMLTSIEYSSREHHFLGLTNPDVNLNRMHQLYNAQDCLGKQKQLLHEVEAKFVCFFFFFFFFLKT